MDRRDLARARGRDPGHHWRRLMIPETVFFHRRGLLLGLAAVLTVAGMGGGILLGMHLGESRARRDVPSASASAAPGAGGEADRLRLPAASAHKNPIDTVAAARV